MSNFRQGLEDETLAVRAVSIGFSSGYHWRLHGSEWGVLVWASKGVITVTVDAWLWVVPPHQAIWIPPQLSHAVRMSGRGTLRQVYVAPNMCRALAQEAHVVPVGALLREVLRRVCTLGTLDRAIQAQRSLFELLVNELVDERIEPFELRMPTDARAVRAAEWVRAAPGHSSNAAAVARHAHASVRTLERLFRAQTGISFGTWRHRARVIHAMTVLADGGTVSAAGAASGYASTSAFVASFRVTVGMTPGRYAAAALRGNASVP